MKTNYLFLILFFLYCEFTSAQTQNPLFFFGADCYSFITTSNIPSNSSYGFYSQNVQSDANGNILFSVVDGVIIDPYGIVIGHIIDPNSTTQDVHGFGEVCITPVPNSWANH